jgi:aspartyl-tRNA synthetase
VDVFGTVAKTPSPVSSCSQSDVEIRIQKLFIVSAAEPRLPLQIEDASRPEQNQDEGLAVVKLDTRLDNRSVKFGVFLGEKYYE